MFCYFCQTKTAHSQQLCFSCFNKAFKTAKEHYETDDLQLMMYRATMGNEGDALTFQYQTLEKASKKDMTGGEFVIDEYEAITELCRYDHHLWMDFFPGWIDLSVGISSGFWEQCVYHGL